MTENREFLINEAAELEDGKLDRLSAEVISLTRAAQKISLYYICEIGERLSEAKAIVGRGGWGEWLKTRWIIHRARRKTSLKYTRNTEADR